MLGEAFHKAYELLNDGQKQAVDTIEGPVMVIAGPGTGKTQILALRIANILRQTDVKPENILALTFTDAGAHAMRERLRRYIGEDGYRVAVHTFHSLARQLIRNYPDSYPSIIGGRPAGDIEKTVILEGILDSSDINILRPAGDPLYYVKKIPGAIAELKKENIDVGEFARRISELETSYLAEPKYHEKGAHKGKIRSSYEKNLKQIAKLRELSLVYRLYQQQLRQEKLYDFEDMIMETVKALETNSDMLLDLQETYQYLLADEHQDVNESQNRILELLASYHEYPNVFVVGDEKQAIYRFQGASLYNFLYFEDRFKDTKVIALTYNYRSTAAILKASHDLIKTDDETLARLRVPLEAAGGKIGPKPTLSCFSHEAIEDDFMARAVEAKIADGVAPEEIAIILRNNRDVIHFTSLLRQHGIDAAPSTDSDILDHPLTILVENLLRSVGRPDQESALFSLLMSGIIGIDTADAASIATERSREWPLWKIISDHDKLESLDLDKPEAVTKFAGVIDKARQQASYTAPHYLLQQLLNDLGVIDRLMRHESLANARVLRRLYHDIETLVVENKASTVTEAIKLLEYRRAHQLPLLAPFVETGHKAVNVLTAHKAKGLEYEAVFIPRATDSCFGASGGRDYFKLPIYQEFAKDEESEEDDRRLFYVAMTRAKTYLHISYSEVTASGKLNDPSRYLSAIAPKLLERMAVSETEAAFDQTASLSRPWPEAKLNPDMIRAMFLRRGLSVTHLNNYLEDPLKYYFENLLRQPKPQSLSLLKGQSVHETLDRALTRWREQEAWPTVAEISQFLKDSLARKPMSDHDSARTHEESLGALVPYMERLKGIVGKDFKLEHRVTATLVTGNPELPEIPLTGVIDRLDLDQEGHILRVTDYKTGKPKSRNEIEGKTKNSNGNYKRQLAFYALLFELSNKDGPRPEKYVLSFVEPKSSGEIVEHEFEVSDQEVAELKDTIIQVGVEIVRGDKF